MKGNGRNGPVLVAANKPAMNRAEVRYHYFGACTNDPFLLKPTLAALEKYDREIFRRFFINDNKKSQKST